MNNICLVITRFKSDKKEAISKNFINLAEGLSVDNNIRVHTISPTPFTSKTNIQQNNFSQSQDYASLTNAIINILKVCQLLRKKHFSWDMINIHIASPIEAFLFFLLLGKDIKKKQRCPYGNPTWA